MSLADIERLRAIVDEVMAVDDSIQLEQPPGAVIFRGRLLADPAEAIEAVGERFRSRGYLTTLDRQRGTDILAAIPHSPPQHRTRPRLALALLLATLASVLLVGGTMTQPDLESVLRRPLSGLPFAVSLLAILGTHEMGHYLVARRGGVQVSLPYFIPMPLGPLGTMGAFINMRSPPRSRSQLLRIGLAGPLSGLVVAIVVLIYGLKTSTVGPLPEGQAFLQEGNSVFYLVLKRVILGRWLPGAGLDVDLSPVAFAGWAGLLVTGLNLIPAAQLDGGHVAYALLGRTAQILTVTIAAGMFLLGLAWPGWYAWAVLILLLGSRRHLVLDDVTPLNWRERLLAVLGLLLAALLFVPVPLMLVQP
ncbi:MAG: site-2 protease family protein [Anaerolineae bacterium]|nr:site-2 protease family protein [Anaerolineae bacterium]